MRWLFALSGLLWGLFAALLGQRAFHAHVWGGVVASPFIGLIVGTATQSYFEQLSGYWRWGIALASLYLGAILYGVGIGIWDVVAGGPGRIPIAVVTQDVVAVLWGVTLTGFLLFLWPMAFLTHLLLEWRAEGRTED
ncbi:MAG TPA: hypothetical protein VLT17_00355 [Gemmatimonadales bacterium]|jgi:uncharacterized membrane protein YadS|nr:hypothetical protein [Gemmatimonadales bacterium]